MDDSIFWPGASGHQYVHNRYRFDAVERLPWACNYIAVCNDFRGLRPLYIGQTDDLVRRWGEHWRDGLTLNAMRLGVNEIHVHLLAKTEAERIDVETDLRNGHRTPLNRQPTKAPTLGMFGSAAPRRGFLANVVAGESAQASALAPFFDTPPNALFLAGLTRRRS